MLIFYKHLSLLILRFSCVRRTVYCLVHAVFQVRLKTKFSTTHVISISLKSNMKREDQQDVTIKMFIINFCLNMFRASLCPSSGGRRPCYCIWCVVLVLFIINFCLSMFRASLCPSSGGRRPCYCTMCSHPARQRPTTATNHIQQNQNNTPNAVTGPSFS